jgi:hypothetical protein
VGLRCIRSAPLNHLETLLHAVQTLQNLPPLVAALGHQPLWESVPSDIWPWPISHGRQVVVIGRTAELPWFALESQEPGKEATLFARRLGKRGRVAIVIALDAVHRQLAIALALEGYPGVQINLAAPGREAVASIRRLSALPEGGTLAFATKAADALSAQTVSHRFFRVFRSTLEAMAAKLPGPMNAADRHSLALLQLTRVLFLYFIQSKGWLAGRDRFLAEQVDSCLARHRSIQRDLLRPLFFGTLNQPRLGRSRTAAGFGELPFLNGGLFEPHALERRHRTDVANEVWRDAFDLLFERFHFTVTEGEADGRVAPDMLGRVFEGVMEPDQRRASGTFYTPAALVSAILDAALVPLLERRLHCTAAVAERRLMDADPQILESLRSLTILDPAVGSGAFLLASLERLAGPGISGQLTSRKRRVLKQNLFGVDQSAAAVRLTELRLWLAVIADDPAEGGDKVAPLPNLDCLIRQGDSLFDPVGLTQGTTPRNRALVAEMSALRRAVVPATGAEKRLLVRKLHRIEARVLGDTIEAAEEDTELGLRECLDQARGLDLFGQRRGLDRELRNRMVQLRCRLRSLRRAHRELDRDGEVPWFHYQSHFADVFARGGFDLVLGNPPWLRSEAIPVEVRTRLAGRYRWWRTAGGAYGNRPDLAVAFVERALELTRPGGVMAMLVPAKIATTGYGVALRHGIASTTTLHVVAEVTREAGAEFDATVYPMALIASKEAPAPTHRLRHTLEDRPGSSIRQSGLRGGAPWILMSDNVRGIVAGLARSHGKLGDRFTCRLGVKTGLNQLFLNPPEDLEPEVLRWAVRGRNLKPFRFDSTTRFLWTHGDDGRPRPELPPKAASYVAPFLAELRARSDARDGLPWAVFRARPAIAAYRVIWADLSRTLAAAALTTASDLQYIPLNSCYIIVATSANQAETLAAWLNSTWLRAAARLVAVPASGGFSRFNAQTVSALPLPESALTDPALSDLNRAGREGIHVQEELDVIVARHLGLSGSAQNALRAVVDGTTSNCR